MTSRTGQFQASMTVASGITMLLAGFAGAPNVLDIVDTEPTLSEESQDFWGYERLAAQIGEQKTSVIAKMIDDSMYPELIQAMITVESSWWIDAVSSYRAIGLMQIREIAAQEIEPDINENALFDPMRNVEIGIQIFEQHMNYFGEYNDTEHWALSSYNRGRAGAFALKHRPPTTTYSRKVLQLTGTM